MQMFTKPKFISMKYRICDELTCSKVAIRTIKDDSDPIEHNLCEAHYLKYKAELKDNANSNA